MIVEVDRYLAEAKKWKEEMEQIRMILIEAGLTEAWKWKSPTYTYDGNNVAIIGSFKDYCCLSFFKGALLEDKEGILVSPGKNSQSSRIFKTTDVDKVIQWESTLKKYLTEAIENEKKGLKVDFKHNKELVYPEEFQAILDDNKELKQAFENLTPGRQRGYNIYFSSAKQSKTRTNRVEKYIDRILAGKGINDCVCGHSKRMPSCDGSHKYL